MDIIQHYFPNLSEKQKEQFSKLPELYAEWNAKINVVSRKDINELLERHVLHSLAIAKIQQFKSGASVMDVGTGGGFPGIPLAILFPETESLGLNNLKAEQKRAGTFDTQFDFIISRAVTRMPDFVKWVRKNIKKKSNHELKNGILYLKGGDLTEELSGFTTVQQFEISNFFSESFFETKKLVLGFFCKLL